MVDSEIASLLRKLINEFSREAQVEKDMRRRTAMKPPPAADKDSPSADSSPEATRKAVKPVPTMWR